MRFNSTFYYPIRDLIPAFDEIDLTLEDRSGAIAEVLVPLPASIKDEEKNQEQTRKRKAPTEVTVDTDSSKALPKEPLPKKHKVKKSGTRIRNLREPKKSQQNTKKSTLKAANSLNKRGNRKSSDTTKQQQQQLFDNSCDDGSGSSHKKQGEDLAHCPDPECSKIYANLSTLRKHVRDRHQKEIIMRCNGGCTMPPSLFTDRKLANLHLAREHNGGRFGEFMEFLFKAKPDRQTDNEEQESDDLYESDSNDSDANEEENETVEK